MAAKVRVDVLGARDGGASLDPGKVRVGEVSGDGPAWHSRDGNDAGQGEHKVRGELHLGRERAEVSGPA